MGDWSMKSFLVRKKIFALINTTVLGGRGLTAAPIKKGGKREKTRGITFE